MHKDDAFTVIDCETEIGLHYLHWQPCDGQFSLAGPYQKGRIEDNSSNSPSTSAFSNAQLLRGQHNDATTTGACDSNSVPGRKRKRATYQPNDRELEAEERHKAIEPFLLATLAAFRQWLNSTGAKRLNSALGLGRPQQALATGGAPLPLESDKDKGGVESLNLLALAELRAVLKPKFVFLDDGVERQNLFDSIIESGNKEEKVGIAHEAEVLIPGGSCFLLSDFTNFKLLIPGPTEQGFDCIVLDPPWENKSAKRAQKYPTLLSRQLLQIPVPQLLNQISIAFIPLLPSLSRDTQPTFFGFSEQGGLVALWMTNRQKLFRFVEQEMLPGWGLQRISSCYWLKVTDSGELVGPLESAHRRPYEVLLLAAPKHWQPAQPVKRSFAIFAVPGQHSRKPHIGRVLQPFLPANAKCLELFARELAKGWTSAGNEVLAFQRLDLFRQRN